jgi:hypothetical protein
MGEMLKINLRVDFQLRSFFCEKTPALHFFSSVHAAKSKGKRMGELLIGTSGYDYPDWKGGFYPEGNLGP